MNIRDLSHSSLTPLELLEAARRLTERTKSTSIESPLVTWFITMLEEGMDKLAAAINKSSKNEFTEELLEKDKVRDASYLCFRFFVKSMQYAATEKERNAADLIDVVLKKHGYSLYRLGYAQQTATVKLMFDDLAQEELVNAIQTIGSEALVERLKSTQTSFEETYQKKVASGSQENYLVAEEKKAVANNLDTLFRNLEALHKQSPNEEMEGLGAALTEIVTETMSIAKSRQTREKNQRNDIDNQ